MKKKRYKFRSSYGKGKDNPFYGKHHTEEFKKRIAKLTGDRVRGVPFTKKHKENISKALKGRKQDWMIGDKNWNYRHDLDDKFIKQKYQDGESCESLACELKCSLSTIIYRLKKMGIKVKRRVCKPNLSEKKLIQFFQKHNLPYKYVGDGSVWLGKKCPDFINVNGTKEVVELFGRNFHDNSSPRKIKEIPYHQTEEGTIEYYKKFGFSVKVIWEEELQDEVQLIRRFGGVQI